MNEIIKFKRIIVYQILITAALVAAGALAFGYQAAAKGFVLGSLASVVNFLIMVRQAPKKLGQSRNKATAQSLAGLGLRMVILAAPLAAAFKIPGFSVIWTALGIFNLQFSIVIYGLVIERFGLADGATLQRR